MGKTITDALGNVAMGQKTASEMAEEELKGIPLLGNPLRNLVRQNASWIDDIGSGLGNLWHMLQGLVLGMVDSFTGSHQKEAEESSVDAIKNNAGQFTALTQTLKLKPEFAKTLQADVDTATRDAFGMFGLSEKPEDAITASRHLQATLEKHIFEELLRTNGQRITDNAAQKIARDAAASITGLNLNALNSERADLRLMADKPTKGFGGMLLALQPSLATPNAPAPNASFTFDETNFQIVQKDMAALAAPRSAPAPAPAPAPEDPKPNMELTPGPTPPPAPGQAPGQAAPNR